jgi:hypothetical protein
MNIKEKMIKMIEEKNKYKTAKKEVHHAIFEAARDHFISYEDDQYGDHYIESVNPEYADSIAIQMDSTIEEDRIAKFCQKTGLTLTNTQIHGDILCGVHYTYLFQYEDIPEDDPCIGCYRNIECEDCVHSEYY